MKSLTLFFCLIISSFGFGQDSISELLKTYNTGSVPYISVQELAMPKSHAIILDARETAEYKVSHIKNAIHVGYSDFNIASLKNQVKNTSKTIVIYCSVGIRSENIGEQLIKAGYTNVYNLFGGIFEWKNNDLSLIHI